jgi:hypothetical protein
MGVEHHWSWAAAKQLDDAGLLAEAVREAANKVLQAIDEPVITDQADAVD